MTTLPDWAPQYDLDRPLHNKAMRSVCYAPFTTLDFGPFGDVIVCCANHAQRVGNVREQSLREIWHSKAMEELRDALTQYDFSKGCDRCAWYVAQGDFKTSFSKKDDVYDIGPEWIKGPLKMDFRLSNICNFACIMCHGDCSSRIRKEVQKLPPIESPYAEPFFSQLKEFLPRLQYSWFTGGEPFLVEDNYRIWDMMIECAPQIRLRITTNGSILTPRVQEILENLTLVDLCVSIDGATKQTFEKVRRGAHFEKVVEHLDYFSEYCRRTGANLRFSTCGLLQNWHELPDIFLLAARYGASVWMNTVLPGGNHHAGPVSIHDAPPRLKKRISEFLAWSYPQIQGSIDDHSDGNYQMLMNTLGAPLEPDEAGALIL
ncbi:MAG: radical SAM protein [Candidatus Omnitrophica bacterium]|nr:radical SAM protein [Candidatus Omnitrophota bacterium]